MIVPIFTDEVQQQGGWHGQMLSRAFEKRGHQAVLIDLQDCLLDLSQHRPQFHLPCLDNLPRMAFVRGIAAGTMQQVTMRLNFLHMLNMQGVKVYNQGRAIERTVDKAMTSFLLKQAGIATPNTWVCETRKHAHQVIETQQKNEQTLVIKPLFGSQGQGVRLITPQDKKPLPQDAFVHGVFYLQEKIDTGKHNYDYRVFVVGDRAIATMRRSGEGWLHNVARGAKCTLVHEYDVIEIALQAARILDINYCGVDVIRDKDGQLLVLEVNSIPAWKGLQSVTDVNIAQTLVDDLIESSHD